MIGWRQVRFDMQIIGKTMERERKLCSHFQQILFNVNKYIHRKYSTHTLYIYIYW